LWAIACTVFFVFFRLGELLLETAQAFNQSTNLAWGDVAMDSLTNPQRVQVHLKMSKYDQIGARADLVMGVTGTVICPVATMVDYLQSRGTQPGPFFLDSQRKAVTKPWFLNWLWEVLASIGIQAHQYVGHNFRIGAATTAALASVPDSTIQMLGRWNSSAFLRYIRSPKDHLAGISASLAHQPASLQQDQPGTLGRSAGT